MVSLPSVVLFHYGPRIMACLRPASVDFGIEVLRHRNSIAMSREGSATISSAFVHMAFCIGLREYSRVLGRCIWTFQVLLVYVVGNGVCSVHCPCKLCLILFVFPNGALCDMIGGCKLQYHIPSNDQTCGTLHQRMPALQRTEPFWPVE